MKFIELLTEAKKKSIWQGSKAQKVIDEFKKGKLKPFGSDKNLDPENPADRKQAFAIAASEQKRKDKKK